MNPVSELTLSADGRYIAFTSGLDGLVNVNLPRQTTATGPVLNTDLPNTNAYVHDRVTGITELVSVDSLGNPANQASGWVSISADGRYVAFASTASNLAANQNDKHSFFVHDRFTQTTTRVLQAPITPQMTYANPTLSQNGRYLAYTETTNTATGYQHTVFMLDIPTGDVVPVSGGTFASISKPVISADGRYVAFITFNPDDNFSTWSGDVRVFDRVTNTISVIDNFSGKSGVADISISDDGGTVAYGFIRGGVFVADNPNATTGIIEQERLYPASDAMITTAQLESNLSWSAVNGAEWYSIYIQNGAGTPVYNQWVAATEVCNGGVCTLNEPVWMMNGSYEWWMAYYVNGFTSSYLAPSTFGIGVRFPAPVASLDASTVAGTTTISWPSDSNASWYRVYVGGDNGFVYDEWVNPNCEETCTLNIELAADSYNVWIQSWGPGGLSEWQVAPYTFRTG